VQYVVVAAVKDDFSPDHGPYFRREFTEETGTELIVDCIWTVGVHDCSGEGASLMLIEKSLEY
jgi:hypothetical protein